jgi:hypothetical protein
MERPFVLYTHKHNLLSQQKKLSNLSAKGEEEESETGIMGLGRLMRGGESEHYNFPIGVSCFNKFIYNSKTIERVSQSFRRSTGKKLVAQGMRIHAIPDARFASSCFLYAASEQHSTTGVGDFTFSQAQNMEKCGRKKARRGEDNCELGMGLRVEEGGVF